MKVKGKFTIGNYTLTDVDGSADQSFSTDGAGTVTWKSFLKLDQTAPQTFSAGTVTGTGILKVTSGTLGLDTSTYLTSATATLSVVLSAGNNGLGNNVYLGDTTPVTPVQRLELQGVDVGLSVGNRWTGTSGNSEIYSYLGKPASDGTFTGTGAAYFRFVERQLDTDATKGRKGTRIEIHTWNNNTSSYNYIANFAANGFVGFGTAFAGPFADEPIAQVCTGVSVAGQTALRSDAVTGAYLFSSGSTGIWSIDSSGIIGGRFIMLDNGNVGIGNHTPTHLLDVGGVIYASSSITGSSHITIGGTSSQFVKGDGTLDSSTYITSVTAHNILSATHGDTLTDTVVRGDILYGNATPKWARLPFPGTPTGKVIQATATDVTWSTNPITIGSSASVSGSNTGDQFTSETGSTLIGRGSASGSGPAQEITIGTGLSMSGTTLSASGASSANTALSNLVSVAINVSLLPGTTNSIDLGSNEKTFQNIYLGGTANPYSLELTSATISGSSKTVTFPNRTLTIDNITTSTTTNGTGFVKGNGSAISFDNSTYLTSLSGALLVTGATTGATTQTQIFTNTLQITALTASKVVFTDASKNLTSTGIGTSSQFIKGDGSLDSSTYLTSVTSHNILSSTHGDTLADTVVRGDILIGNLTPKWTRLAKGSSGQFLTLNLTDVIWSTATLPATATGTGKILVADGTNWVASTPTFPNSSATSGKIIKSDGTNWLASTETYAAPGTLGNVLRSDGTNWVSSYFATHQSSPANPTGTTSATQVMMGLAGSFTPGVNGNVLLIISGVIMEGNASAVPTIQIRYGTGSAPANGAAATGTAVGTAMNNIKPGTAGYPFSLQAVVTGLTIGTTYWIDVGLAASISTASIIDVSLSACGI